MGPGDLSRVLAPLAPRSDPRLIVGHETFDDAGIFVLSDDLALVQTVDFFAPIVDDPYAFGQVAAANALSDVYAMGGEPLTALNIVGFPVGKAPLEVLSEILRGGQDKVAEAGAVIAGGHSVVDDEVKYGLAVTGRVHPRHVLTNAGARPGDVLVLTKPLGTGLVTTGVKQGRLPESTLAEAVRWMTRLNRDASRAALDVGSRCATDVTGFGLLGHASHIARASGVRLRIEVARLPVLAAAHDAVARGVTTGGAGRNADYLETRVNWGSVDAARRAILVDPQTSGGLLVAVPRDRVADYLSRVPDAVEIGAVEPGGEPGIALA
jgi:selenide,water dikinase